MSKIEVKIHQDGLRLLKKSEIYLTSSAVFNAFFGDIYEHECKVRKEGIHRAVFKKRSARNA